MEWQRHQPLMPRDAWALKVKLIAAICLSALLGAVALCSLSLNVGGAVALYYAINLQQPPSSTIVGTIKPVDSCAAYCQTLNNGSVTQSP